MDAKLNKENCQNKHTCYITENLSLYLEQQDALESLIGGGSFWSSQLQIRNKVDCACYKQAFKMLKFGEKKILILQDTCITLVQKSLFNASCH